MSTAARALALFIGLFSFINLLTRLRLNIWWIDFDPLPPFLGHLLLGAASVALVAWSVKPAALPLAVTVTLVGVLLAASLWNVVRFYALWADGSIHPGCWFPLSIAVAAALTLVLLGMRRPPEPANAKLFALVFAAASVAFPLAQMMCFGQTDYRRPADAAVVFGARAYASGMCSTALADRVRTAVALYREGTVRTLVFSGAEGDGDVHETEAMRRLALRLGVRDEDIVCDLAGVNTQATVANTAPMLRGRRVIAVSHWYHLPRVKLCYQAAGIEVFTVPANQSYVLSATPVYVARETVALWGYYLRSLVG
jgi:vancomycin permeability regulator SanA